MRDAADPLGDGTRRKRQGAVIAAVIKIDRLKPDNLIDRFKAPPNVLIHYPTWEPDEAVVVSRSAIRQVLPHRAGAPSARQLARQFINQQLKVIRTNDDVGIF